MTITSTGPSGFHVKPLVTVFAAVAIVAGVFAIAQTIGTDSQPGASSPSEVSAEAAEPNAGPSGSSEALAAGKFDAGLVPEPSPATAGSEPAPEIVVIEGQGSHYDALIEGKYDLDFAPGDPAVQYVLVPAATGSGGQFVEGFGDGPFTELSETSAATEPAPEIVVIEGQGSGYDALIDGKYDLDFASGDPAVQYVLVPAAATDSGGQLVEGFGDGLAADPSKTFSASQPAAEVVVIEGQGSGYDALIDGKYDLDFAPGDPAVQYVLIPAAATDYGGQLVEGLGDRPFTEPSPTAGTADHTPTVSGGPQE